MIRRIFCFLFNHDWRDRVEAFWHKGSTLHVCHRCGRCEFK